MRIGKGTPVAVAAALVVVGAALAACGSPAHQQARRAVSASVSSTGTGAAPSAVASAAEPPSPVPEQPAAAAFTATAISFPTPRIGWALGGVGCAGDGSSCRAALERTVDGGRTWRRVAGLDAMVRCGLGGEFPPGRCVARIEFADGRNGWLYGGPNGSGVLSTHDGGRSWRVLRFGDVALDSGGGYVVAVTHPWARGVRGGARVLRSVVTTDAWRRVPAPRDLQVEAPDVVVLGGSAWIVSSPHFWGRHRSRSLLLGSTDDGRRFDRLADPCHSTVAAVAAVNANVVYLECDAITDLEHGRWRHALYRSTDGGRSWHRAGTPPPAGDVGDLTAPTPDTVFLTTDAGDVIVSRDGGRHWRVALRSTRREHDAVVTGRSYVALAFPSTRTGEALAGDGTIWTTSDGGRTWRMERW